MRAGTAADAEARWKRILDQEHALFEGKPVEKVMVIGLDDILGLEDAITANAEKLGPIHGVLDTLGDSTMAGSD